MEKDKTHGGFSTQVGGPGVRFWGPRFQLWMRKCVFVFMDLWHELFLFWKQRARARELLSVFGATARLLSTENDNMPSRTRTHMHHKHTDIREAMTTTVVKPESDFVFVMTPHQLCGVGITQLIVNEASDPSVFPLRGSFTRGRPSSDGTPTDTWALAVRTNRPDSCLFFFPETTFWAFSRGPLDFTAPPPSQKVNAPIWERGLDASVRSRQRTLLRMLNLISSPTFLGAKVADRPNTWRQRWRSGGEKKGPVQVEQSHWSLYIWFFIAHMTSFLYLSFFFFFWLAWATKLALHVWHPFFQNSQSTP